MSILNDDNNSFKSNIFDDDNIKLSSIINEDDECSNSSFSLSQKSQPLFINNESFINYFMHIDYNTPLAKYNNNEINNTINIFKDKSNSDSPKKSPSIKTSDDSNNKIKNNEKDKNNEKEYGIIFDSKTGISYYEEEDPVNYRKAKKRIQNRESALRMKKMREGANCKLEDELCHLKEDNIRLINENISLKKEKEFLIDQIKFMQKIIKESNLEFKLKNAQSDNSDSNSNNSTSDEKNDSTKSVFYYDGSKQKIKGKLFNVFSICFLSIIYIYGECGINKDIQSSGQNSNLRSGNSIQLNSIKDNISINNNISIWYYFSKIILFLIFVLIIPLLKEAGKFIKNFMKKNRLKNYFTHNKHHY